MMSRSLTLLSSIRTKITIGFLFVVVLMLFAIALNLSQIKSLDRSVDRLHKTDIPLTLQVLEWGRLLNQSGIESVVYSLHPTDNHLQQVKKTITTLNYLLEQMSFRLQQLPASQRPYFWKKIKTDYAEYASLQQSFIESVNKSVEVGVRPASALLVKIQGQILKIQKSIGTIKSLGGDLRPGVVSYQQAQLAEHAQDFFSENAILTLDQWAIGIVGVVATLLIAFVTGRYVADPFKKAIEIAQLISDGRRDVKIISSRNDEAGALLKALDRMQSSIDLVEKKQRASQQELRVLMLNLQSKVESLSLFAKKVASGDLSQQLSYQSDELLANFSDHLNQMTFGLAKITKKVLFSVGQMHEKVAAVQSAMRDQSQLAIEQASVIDRALTRLDAIKSAKEKTKQGANTLRATSKESMKVGDQGAQAALEVKAGMQSIRQDVQSLSASIAALAAQLNNISEITQTVAALSERSQILSLNASIEAAKAGDAGKGFAVVANQMKALADQSQSSAQKVHQLLNEIQQATQSAVQTSEWGVNGVDRSLVLVERTGAVIDRLTTEIKSAYQSSVAAVEAIEHEGEEIDRINSAMTAVRAVSENVLAASRQCVDMVDDFAGISHQLNESVSHYQLAVTYEKMDHDGSAPS